MTRAYESACNLFLTCTALFFTCFTFILACGIATPLSSSISLLQSVFPLSVLPPWRWPDGVACQPWLPFSLRFGLDAESWLNTRCSQFKGAEVYFIRCVAQAFNLRNAITLWIALQKHSCCFSQVLLPKGCWGVAACMDWPPPSCYLVDSSCHSITARGKVMCTMF